MVDFLWWAETQHMGLAGNRRRTEQVAERLMRLHGEPAPDAEPLPTPERAGDS